MKVGKAMITAIIVAAACIILGIIICAAGMLMIDFDLTELNSATAETNVHEITQDFDSISIDVTEADVRLEPSADGVCRVVCEETDRVRHSVSVTADTLSIGRVDTRKWYERFGIFFNKMSVCVYLPEDEYGELKIKSVSGNIVISLGCETECIEVNSTSGDVSFSAVSDGNVVIKSVSGNITAADISAGSISVKSTSGRLKLARLFSESDITLGTTSGDMMLDGCEADNIYADTTSGKLSAENAIAVKYAEYESVSGDMKLSACDAQELKLKAVSGDITATLLSEKSYFTHTVSGNVFVPPSVMNTGKCDVSTTSGNIRITLAE